MFMKTVHITCTTAFLWWNCNIWNKYIKKNSTDGNTTPVGCIHKHFTLIEVWSLRVAFLFTNQKHITSLHKRHFFNYYLNNIHAYTSLHWVNQSIVHVFKINVSWKQLRFFYVNNTWDQNTIIYMDSTLNVSDKFLKIKVTL